MTPAQLLALLPHAEPFRFVQSVISVDEQRLTGTASFSSQLDFYRGHFPGFPVTPGCIISEAMAQTGLTAFGIYLRSLETNQATTEAYPLLTSAQTDYYKAVGPGESLRIESEKIYFRFGKLKCRITAFNSKNEKVAEGIFSGMMVASAKLQS
jgi:3-hydroxyacyl-[acyl-carrier-protein] dehydratase